MQGQDDMVMTPQGCNQQNLDCGKLQKRINPISSTKYCKGGGEEKERNRRNLQSKRDL